MKRFLLLLLVAFPFLSRAQIPALISSNDSAIHTLVETVTLPGSWTHTHEAYLMYQTDSILRQLFNSIGASGNLQAVTALGNNTTTGIYVGSSGNYAHPNTGTRIVPNTQVQEYSGGVYQGGFVGNGFQSTDLTSGNVAKLMSGVLSDSRIVLIPDEGDGTGLPSTVVLHKTKDQITVGDTSTQATKQTIYGDWCYKSGIPFSYMGDDGAGAWEAILTSSTHGGTTTVHDDTSASTLNQWLSTGSGTYAMLDDTLRGHNGLQLLTKHAYDSLIAISTPNLQKVLIAGDSTTIPIKFYTNGALVVSLGQNTLSGTYNGDLRLRDTTRTTGPNAGLYFSAFHAFADADRTQLHMIYGPSNSPFGRQLAFQVDSNLATIQVEGRGNGVSGHITWTELDSDRLYYHNSNLGSNSIYCSNTSSTTYLDTVRPISGNVAFLSDIPTASHIIFTPTTGNTVNVVGNSYNIINPSGALLALTVNLPSSPANNTTVYVKYTQAVTTVTYTGGTVVDGITSPIAGGFLALVYDAATTSWY